MPAFSSLTHSEIVNFLRSVGKSITSLQVVGTFLQHVGYQMLLDMHLKYDRQVFYPRARARRIDVVLNESGSGVQYHTQVERIDAFGNTLSVMKFVTKHVVLASGGR
jgi:hypothetical protein